MPPRSAVEVALPVAGLSSKSSAPAQPFAVTSASEPRLTPLLDYLAGQPDAPRATAQLAVLCLLENLNYGQWIQLLSGATSASAPGDTHPTPADITQAVDVLGLLRQLAPQQTFALASDSELKLRAPAQPVVPRQGDADLRPQSRRRRGGARSRPIAPHETRRQLPDLPPARPPPAVPERSLTARAAIIRAATDSGVVDNGPERTEPRKRFRLILSRRTTDVGGI